MKNDNPARVAGDDDVQPQELKEENGDARRTAEHDGETMEKSG